jgi:hypothetical protein
VNAGKQVGRFSVEYWRRAIAAYGIDGLGRAVRRSVRSKVRPVPSEPSFIQLGGQTDDPIEAMYLGFEAGAIPILRVPVTALRAERLGIVIDDTAVNPFTKTVADFLSAVCVTYEGSALQDFYGAWQPARLDEFLGIETEGHSNLRQPLVADLLPWERSAGRDELEARRAAEERTWLLKFGESPTGSHGSSYFGPTSDALGTYRFGKHTKVATSIANDAMTKDTSDEEWWDPSRGGYVEIQMVVHGDKWAGIIREGKHRTTALAALQVSHLLVSIPPRYPVIRREEARSWPGVRQGLYTLDEALAVFDRFLSGEAPAGFPRTSSACLTGASAGNGAPAIG